MRTQRMQYILISLFFLAATLFGCSRGGSDQAADSPPLSATVAASGELKLATAGMPNTIAGIGLTVNLPAGVSVNADPATGEVASGVVTISGAAAAGGNNLAAAKYVPATDRAPAQLHIAMLNLAGFPLGEFVTINFDQTAGGELPASNAFTVASFSAKGIDGSTLDGIRAAPLSVDAVGNAAMKAFVTVVGTPPQPTPALTMIVDTPTRFPTQTITGTLRTGLTLTVTATAPAVVSNLTITGVDWSALVSGLVEGPNTVTATTFTGAGRITATATIVLDTIPPFINIDSAIGAEKSAMLQGTAELGSTITVVCDDVKTNVVFFDDLTQNVTQWSAAAFGLLAGSNHLCVVTAVDAAGNTNTAQVDAKPQQINIVYPNLEIYASLPVKYGKTLTVSGTVDPGITPAVTVSTPSATVSPVTVTGSTWSCTVSGLPAGDTTVSVTATDALGHVTTKTATVTAVVPNGSFSGALHPGVADALKALRIAVGLDVVKYEDVLHGDLYVDDLIDVADAILILEHAIGLFDNVLGFNNLYPHLLSSPGR